MRTGPIPFGDKKQSSKKNHHPSTGRQLIDVFFRFSQLLGTPITKSIVAILTVGVNLIEKLEHGLQQLTQKFHSISINSLVSLPQFRFKTPRLNKKNKLINPVYLLSKKKQRQKQLFRMYRSWKKSLLNQYWKPLVKQHRSLKKLLTLKKSKSRSPRTSVNPLTFSTPSIRLPRITLPKIIFPQPTLPRVNFKLPLLKVPRIRVGSTPKPIVSAKLIFASLAVIGITSLGVASGYYFYDQIIRDLPDPQALSTRQPNLTTKIFASDGRTLLYKIYKQENRSLVPLQELPPQLIKATISIEDQDYYSHSGLSLKGIARAFKTNLTEDRLQGGSTITQQLIKNTLLTTERTWVRKIKEAILAVITEFYYNKDEILTMYFNQIPYGGAAYGAEEASQMYFGKSVRELDLAESAFLAGLPAAPTKYSPYSNPQEAKNRQLLVLGRMVEDGYITKLQSDIASAQELNIKPPRTDILAPHFVMYVKDYLAEKYGTTLVEQGGLEVITSIDLETQAFAEQVVRQEVDALAGLQVSNGAALITRPNTGEIIAMVGSRDYFATEQDGQVNVTLRERQPGSSIKPINYALALENGLTPASIIPDTPICFEIRGQAPYCPKNYDGSYHGNVTLRQALANSYNIPAVKTLNQFGVSRMIDKAEAMGITTWKDRSRFGLSLTLGGGEVRMVDMAVVYGAFANQGLKVPLNPILKVTDAHGKVLEVHPCVGKTNAAASQCGGIRVLDPRVAYQITSILSDNNARAQAFGLNSVLNIPNNQVAVKTGTTNNLRDNWTFGYTNNLLVSVWVGNNNNTPMSRIASGITGASKIWHDVMVGTLKDQAPHQFSVPTNLQKVAICTLTGTLSCEGCPTKEEYFIPGTEPKNHCSLEQVARMQNRRSQDGENNPN